MEYNVKRAGFNWGIGRDLYDFPVIQVKLKSKEWEKVGDKAKATYNLNMKNWKWSVKRDNKDNVVVVAVEKVGRSYIQRYSSADPGHKKALEELTVEQVKELF